MANQFISSLSKQKIFAEVTTTAVADPTSDTVAVAVAPTYTPVTTWAAATWVTQPGGVFLVSVLIGPGTDIGPLAVGIYNVWVRVTDNPEIPVMRATDTLTIY